MRYLLTSLLCVFTLSLTAQLSNGSIAPNFTASDIEGNEWSLSGHKTEANFLKYIKVTGKERAKRIAEHKFFQ